MAEFLLDFDQVALAGRSSRHRPTFPARQLEHSIPNLREGALVREHQRFHHDQWYLPLYDAYVRTWLKVTILLWGPWLLGAVFWLLLGLVALGQKLFKRKIHNHLNLLI